MDIPGQTKRFLATLAAIYGLSSCATDTQGLSAQTPRVEIPIPYTDSVLWGYGVIGISSNHSVNDGKSFIARQ